MKIINLLPKPRQQELYYERIFSSLVVVLWLSLVSFILVFAAQLGAKIYLQQEESSVVAQTQMLKSQVSKAENEQIKKKIGALNNYIADFKTLSKMPKWSKALSAFSALPPDEVGITAVNFDLKNRSMSIQGFAPTREKVDEFFYNIKADEKEFTGVDYPFENVAKPTDNSFHFTFYIKDELIQ